MVLNEKQKTLLDMVEKEKYILVKAPAGTGKTFCSIQCAKRYIEKNKEFNKNKTIISIIFIGLMFIVLLDINITYFFPIFIYRIDISKLL